MDNTNLYNYALCEAIRRCDLKMCKNILHSAQKCNDIFNDRVWYSIIKLIEHDQDYENYCNLKIFDYIDEESEDIDKKTIKLCMFLIKNATYISTFFVYFMCQSKCDLGFELFKNIFDKKDCFSIDPLFAMSQTLEQIPFNKKYFQLLTNFIQNMTIKL